MTSIGEKYYLIIVALLIISAIACIEKKAIESPPKYDLTKPVKYNMPDGLLEISGIAFHNAKADSIYGQQDEDGRIYYFKPGDKKINHSKFAGHGDYEDIAIADNWVYMLRSNGTIFNFKFKDVRNANIPNVNEIKDLLPVGEYEGMYADVKAKQLYVLCKACKTADPKKKSTGYIFSIASDGELKSSGNFTIDVKDIEKHLSKSKLSFKPSALAKNPVTNEWYILSSVNKALIVTDAKWQVKAAYALQSSLFLQPEGIAFDEQNNLYISNEGDTLTPGTILKFSFKK